MDLSKSDNTLEAYDRYNITKRLNHEDSSDYFQSKLLTKQLIRLYECGDNIHSRDVVMSCHVAQENLRKTEKILEEKKRFAERKRIDMDDQWVDLNKKQLDFKNTFIYFDKFIEENKDKRKRASAKVTEMMKLLSIRTNNIDQLQKEYHELEETKKLLNHSICNLQIYEKYLSGVVAGYPQQFSSVNDIIKRYEALIDARKELHKYQESYFDQLSETRISLDHLIGNYIIKIVGLNTKLADLHRRYEIARANCQKWENILNNATLKAMEKVMETVFVRDTCWRIYSGMCQRRNILPIYRDNYAKQFDFIKKTLLQYECVNQKIRTMEEEKLKLSEKACASTEVNSRDSDNRVEPTVKSSA